jgi:ATP-dependent Clp protease protease subunit
MIAYSVSPDIKVTKLEDLLSVLPEVVLVNKFDEAAVKEFRTSFDKALRSKQPVVPILIDSYGGQVYSLLAMVDIIKASPKPVATIVQGKAMSCGAILFSCGTEGMRFMGETATIMVHDVASFAMGKVTEIKADVQETERLNSIIYTILARNCGKPDDHFLKIIHDKGHADWFMTPADCVWHNLANHVRLPSLKVSVDVKWSWCDEAGY